MPYSISYLNQLPTHNLPNTHENCIHNRTFLLYVTAVSYLTPKSAGPAETTIPLCHVPAISIAGNDMSAMAADPAFQRLHVKLPSPSPTKVQARWSNSRRPTDSRPVAFCLKAKQPSDKWLLVYQEWWGLNDNIKQQAETFYNDLKDVNVLAVDMYDGKGCY
jgi:carboxymethylenebutenolidase